ncbi:hypothetical protein TUBRATIS_13140 [Tubulinosema ratisbonensis]|uniref:C3H1-type domain-containing protein n=1 Tax=Tubulinosema ratisbonensis TaxID=291195 RepID=A0A437ALX2_9MICR|nr:hypothetical protein TUBRATIS_13140 [Tubulinosema ratisbonensis]
MKDVSLSKLEEENDLNTSKQMSNIKFPLAPQQTNIIKNNLIEEYTLEDAIRIIKETVDEVKPEDLYLKLGEALQPLFREKTKNIVSMLFMFKKKMCRNGENCLIKDKCIFMHESENEKKGKRLLTVDENPKKRINQENNEVIFNKVPSSLANEVLIENYASKFGSVTSIKKLNEGKYLIIFDDCNCARELVYSKDPVLGDSSITKFFNVLLNNKQNELNITDLFEEQNELLNSGPLVLSDPKNFNRFKFICKKIKENFDSNFDKKKKIETKQNNSGFSSFYAEHFK